MSWRHGAAIAACALACAGCASVVDGSTQMISITTPPVTGAACTASNSRGSWSVVTPGSVTISKSESVLTISCTKDGYGEAKYYAAGRMSSAGMIGTMIPYAGIISTAVDASTGAMLTYPETYTIEMKPAPAPQSAAAAPPAPMAPPAPNTVN